MWREGQPLGPGGEPKVPVSGYPHDVEEGARIATTPAGTTAGIQIWASLSLRRPEAADRSGD